MNIWHNKINSSLPFVLIFLFSFVAFLQPLEYIMDNMWNFSIITAAYNGLLPYKDIAMVQMPGWIYVSFPILWIFGTEFITLRILNFITIFAFSSVSYVILKRITGSPLKTFMYTSVVMLLFTPNSFYGYTSISMFCILLASLMCVLKKEKNHPILLGILYGFPMVCKQSTGFVILITHLILSVIFMLKDGNKKYWIKRIVSSFVPIALTLLLITGFGLWNDFIDYTVKGLKSFSKNFCINISANGFYALIVLCCLGLRFLVGVFKRRFLPEEMIYGFVSFSFASCLYPILDDHRIMECIALVIPIVLTDFQRRQHPKLCMVQKYIFSVNPLLLSVLPIVQVFLLITSCFLSGNQVTTTLIVLIPIFFVGFSESNFDKTRLLKVVKIALILNFTLFQLLCYTRVKNAEISLYTEKQAVISSIPYYHHTVTSKAADSLISEVNSKIEAYEEKGYSCYVVDQQGTMFSLPREEYTKHYDLLLNGNTGTKTAKDLFCQAVNGKEKVIFFLKSSERHKTEQEFPGLYELIQEKCTPTNDKVGDLYEVYEYLFRKGE